MAVGIASSLFQLLSFFVTYSYTQAEITTTSYPQVLFDIPKSVKILEGSVLWIYCDINSTSPSLDITWRRNGVLQTQDAPHIILRTSTSFSSTTLLLVIDNVASSDAGLYQCTGQDGTDTATGNTLSIIVSSEGFLNGLLNPRILYQNQRSGVQHNRTVYATNEEVNLYLELTGTDTNENSNISVMWLRNGELVTEMSLDEAERQNGRVIIRLSFTFQESKVGVYQCLLYNNNNSEVYGTFPLRIVHNDTAPSVKRLSPPVVYLTPPEKLVLEFTSNGSFAFLVWHRGRDTLGVSSSAPANLTEFTNFFEIFVREPTTSQDIGNYTVAISGTGKSIKDIIIVSERRMPNTTVSAGQSGLVKVREGESVNISCMSTGAPTPTISWTLNNHSINFSSTDSNKTNPMVTYNNPGLALSVLHIEHSHYPQHDGEYQCMGRNHEGMRFQSTANIAVQVLVVPQVEISALAQEIVIAAGLNLNLTCVITRGNPLPQTYTWTYVESTGGMNSPISLNSAYTILSVQPRDSGIYYCNVTNEAGSGGDYVTVTVNDGPEILFILSSTENFTVAIGSAIELICVVEDDNITVDFTWLNPMGLAVPLTSVNETAASIIVMATGSENFGVYLCLAENEFGSENTTITLSQGTSPPTISLPTTNVYEIVSPARLTLSCSSFGYPLPVITWTQTFQNGIRIELTNNHTIRRQISHSINDIEVISEYSMESTTLQDSANYTCTATNLYGNEANTFTVQVYLPQPNLTVSSLSTNTISLMWTSIEIDSSKILCEVQLEYIADTHSESVFMHFAYNLSDILVGRNSWRFMLEKLLPNTRFNISVRYLYRDTGNYASSMSIPIIVTTYSSVLFQIVFDLPCSTWRNSSLPHKSNVEMALTAKLCQLCQCISESEDVVSNGSLYCSQDSVSTTNYKGHIQGTLSEISNLEFCLNTWIETGPTLIINNSTLTIIRSPVIFSSQYRSQSTTSTLETSTDTTTTITTTAFIMLRYWNQSSPFLISVGTCLVLISLVFGIIIYRKRCCGYPKRSLLN